MTHCLHYDANVASGGLPAHAQRLFSGMGAAE